MRDLNTSNILPRKHRVNLRFISLLAIVVLLQQFSFAALQQSVFFSGHRADRLHYSASLPVKQDAVLFALDIEVAEEDEVQHPEETADADLFTLYTLLHRLYHSSVNSSYLHRSFAVERREDLPLFLLHHSWKTHLS